MNHTHRCRSIQLILGMLLITSAALLAQAGAAAAGGTSATGPVYHVVRSVAGTSTVQQNGHIVVQDSRSVFYLPQDKQVVVYFEWQGPAGKHHFEGVWKDPAGNPSVMSNFDYAATQTQFGGYWTLMLSDQMTPGFWTLEARIDGEVAGTHTIEIRGGEKPAAATPQRQMLTPAQVYSAAAASTVGIETLNGSGDRTGGGVGVVVGDGVVATVFNAIDGADHLQVISANGERDNVESVLAFDRWKDWVLLKVPGLNAKPLPVAPPESLSIGDHAYFITWREGTPSIIEGNLTGKRDDPRNGHRYSASLDGTPGAGAPVINDFGELLGVYGAIRYPGMATARTIYRLPSANFDTEAAPEILAFADVPRPSASMTARTFADLASSGAFLPPIALNDSLLQGTISRDVIAKDHFISSPQDRFEFSRTNPKLVVDLLWNPRSNVKGLVTLDLFDLDNQQLFESKPLKVSMRPGSMETTNWTMNIGSMAAGIYRVDIRLGPQTIWRAFFRVTQ